MTEQANTTETKNEFDPQDYVNGEFFSNSKDMQRLLSDVQGLPAKEAADVIGCAMAHMVQYLCTSKEDPSSYQSLLYSIAVVEGVLHCFGCLHAGSSPNAKKHLFIATTHIKQASEEVLSDTLTDVLGLLKAALPKAENKDATA